MKKIELTKNMTLEVPEHIHSIIDGDKLESCFNAVIQRYRQYSNHKDAATLEQIKNALLDTPDIYLWKDD